MKKGIFVVLFSLLLLFTFSSCDSNAYKEGEKDPSNVVVENRTHITTEDELVNAIASSNDVFAILDNDIEITESILISSNKKLDLDLNNKVITFAEDLDYSKVDSKFVGIKVYGGELILSNGSLYHEIAEELKGIFHILIIMQSFEDSIPSLKMEKINATVKGPEVLPEKIGNYPVILNFKGNAELNSCEFSAPYNTIMNNGSDKDMYKGANFIANNCKFTSTDCTAIYLPSSLSKYEFNNCTATGAWNGLLMRAGDITVNGGKYTSTSDKLSDEELLNNYKGGQTVELSGYGLAFMFDAPGYGKITNLEINNIDPESSDSLIYIDYIKNNKEDVESAIKNNLLDSESVKVITKEN